MPGSHKHPPTSPPIPMSFLHHLLMCLHHIPPGLQPQVPTFPSHNPMSLYVPRVPFPQPTMSPSRAPMLSTLVSSTSLSHVFPYFCFYIFLFSIIFHIFIFPPIRVLHIHLLPCPCTACPPYSHPTTFQSPNDQALHLTTILLWIPLCPMFQLFLSLHVHPSCPISPRCSFPIPLCPYVPSRPHISATPRLPPLFLIVLIPHGIINGVIHQLLLHVHDLCLLLKLHHDLLDLRQLQLWGHTDIARGICGCSHSGYSLGYTPMDTPSGFWWPQSEENPHMSKATRGGHNLWNVLMAKPGQLMATKFSKTSPRPPWDWS